MSSRRLQDMSSRRLQRNNFSSSKTSSRRLARGLENVFKTSSRRLGRRKIVTLKTCWRRLQDVLRTNKCLVGHNTSTVPFEISKTVSFASSVMKNATAFISRFPVKLIYCIAYLNLLQLACNIPWNRYNIVNSQLCNHLFDQLQSF